MSYLLSGGSVITLDPALVERADLRIDKGRISLRGENLEPESGDEVVDVRGKVLMPGLVCSHTHLYSTLARGMPAPRRKPGGFREILELVWWRLDRSLDREAIYYSALVGALEAVRAGTTCLFDHHSSPSWINGSLDVVRDALETIGLRGVLCYEITDRGGASLAGEGLDETDRWLESIRRELHEPASGARASGLFRGMVGAHASFTLEDATLDRCASLMRQYGAGLHIHVAEDHCDVDDARSKYGLGIVERLANHEVLNERTILAHGTCLDQREIQMALDAGVWFAHNPRSNMNNQVGYAPVGQFGSRSVLGTDGISGDMFEETRLAFLKGRDALSPLGAGDWLRALARGQRLATEAFGIELGALIPGSAADLVILNYDPPTPMTADNLPGHLIFGMNSGLIDAVMVNGRFIIRDGFPALDEEGLYARARETAAKLWARYVEID